MGCGLPLNLLMEELLARCLLHAVNDPLGRIETEPLPRGVLTANPIHVYFTDMFGPKKLDAMLGKRGAENHLTHTQCSATQTFSCPCDPIVQERSETLFRGRKYPSQSAYICQLTLTLHKLTHINNELTEITTFGVINRC